jgi:hypothetical protein
MRQPDSTRTNVGDDMRQLADQLAQASQKGQGARLAPQDVDIALTALRAHAGAMSPPKMKITPQMFQIELLDDQGWPEAVLAVIRDEVIARAAFDEAARQRPNRKLKLRLGARVIAKTP